MSSLQRIGTFVIALTLAACTPTSDKRAQPTAGETAGPVAEGDGLEPPLPKGAVARLGTTRFHPGEVVGNLKLSPDGKKLISGGRASGGGMSVWDAVTGKLILRRLLGEEGEVSRDGERLFLIESLPPPATLLKGNVAPVQPEAKNTLKIYQLSTEKLLQQMDVCGWLYRFAVSHDERTVALEYRIPNVKLDPSDFKADWFFKTRLELYDLKASRVTRKLGELPQNYAGNGLVRFSVDGKTLIAVSSSKENENRPESTVRRFDVATGALKSKTTIPNSGFRSSHYA